MLAETREDALCQLASLGLYSKQNEVLVNMDKTKWMGVNVDQDVEIIYDGAALERVEWFPMLGSPLSARPDGSLQQHYDRRKKMGQAYGQWLLLLKQNEDIPPKLAIQLLKAFVVSTGLYDNAFFSIGTSLPTTHQEMSKRCPMERLFTRGLRRILKLPR